MKADWSRVACGHLQRFNVCSSGGLGKPPAMQTSAPVPESLLAAFVMTCCRTDCTNDFLVDSGSICCCSTSEYGRRTVWDRSS